MSRPRDSVTVEFDVPATMRDGVTLRANVYRPGAGAPWPTLLTRTPYWKAAPATSATLDPIEVARMGFMVVVQDTRGRYASDGDWMPFRSEREDGFDSVEWAARLPGSNGRVGMYGASYCGNSQWMAAVEQPPSLAAIAPALTWAEPLDGLYGRGGALEWGVNLQWGLQTNAPQIGTEELFDDIDHLPTTGYWHLPVSETTLVSRHGVPDLGAIRMLSDPDVAAWCRVAGEHERVTVPTLHLGGWHDIFLQGTLDNYMAMAALGRPARLVVGPWSHGEPLLADPVGELCFGMRSLGVGVPVHQEGDLNDLQLAWLGSQLSADADRQPAPADAPVRIFVMGRNEWRDEVQWPPTRAVAERWFLREEGALGPEAPTSDPAPTEFTYDPGDPVPTVGGHIVMDPAFLPGPFDQARVEARRDVCVFTSERLQRDLEVTGRIRVVLHAESSAPSTDWVARLCDVHPDGRSYNLCDGIVRVSDGADAFHRVEIDLWSTSNVFLAGHRLRVHVTSSSFPRWDRNLNTGKQTEPRFEVARQLVHHGAQRPSWIELPVVRG